MQRKSLVLLVGLALFLGAVALPTAAADPPSSLDSDDDGLSDGWELILGTDPTVPDSDGDGIIDGGDPDILITFLEGIDDDVFKDGEPGLRTAATARLEAMEGQFLWGFIE